MLILRPIESTDLADLVRLAKLLNSVNLPSDERFLEQRIEHSIRSFSGRLEADESGLSVFVLEDRETGRAVGTSMIVHKHGAPDAPSYWLEVSSEERRSVELDRRFVHKRLQLRKSEDGPTEIGGLILDPEYRGHPEKCGKALSIVRFAYMSLHPDRFERDVVAEMLSPFEESGENLLWEAFGAHFTGLSYREADRLSARDKRFIADLFPSEPVYVTLFPKNVQSAIGEPDRDARAALRILERVGFQYLNQVDPFDGGPYYGAARDAITSVAERRQLVLPTSVRPFDPGYEGPLALLSSESEAGFRATVVPLDQDDAPIVSEECRAALGVKGGDRITVTPLP